MSSGSALMVNLQIQALDELPLPPGLTVDSAWVRSAGGQWSTAPSRESRPELAHGLDLILRGGPKWPSNGEERYVQTTDQPIGAVD
jgi:hypothetical protein